MMTNQSLEDNLFKNLDDDKLYVTESISEQWRQISKWTYGMAFIGFLFLLLLAFALFGFVTSIMTFPVAFYLGFFVVAVFIFAISRNLYRFSWRIKNAANYSDWTDLENGFNNFWWVHVLYGSIMVLICLIFLGMLAFFTLKLYL
ncbi:MAG: hypothetical protein JNJ57_14280 [Saprospiraceae bacterium]|nr:hypothetical protein [Saprospiraceae bacterium]